MSSSKGRVLVAMSGGVDSSVAAALLKDQGYEAVGACMQVWDYSKSSQNEGYGTCCSHSDVEDARKVCSLLDIPFYVINCEDVFKEKVIDPFVEDYQLGKTPIPCTNCNTFLKFHYLVKKMKELNCDYLATGHYASVKKLKNGEYGIFMSSDLIKDQTYFLFTINPNLISQLLFPIGEKTKGEIRKIAEEKALPVFNKKDSTGICFIGSEGYQNFIEKYFDPKHSPSKGEIKLYPSGEILGEHGGIHRFTVGQRKGLGVSYSKPLYVIRILSECKEIWLGEEKYLYSSRAELDNVHLLDNIENGEKLKVKIRFHHKGDEAYVHRNGNSYQIEFVQPQKSITPGQSAVFYRDRHLVGGGFIKKALDMNERIL